MKREGFEFAAIMDTDLRRRKIRDRVPMTFVTAEPYIGHLGLGGVGDSKGMMESLFRDRHIRWICNAKTTKVEAGKMHDTEHNDDGTHSDVTATSVTTTTLTATTGTVTAFTGTSGQVSLSSTGIGIATGAGLTPLAAHGYKFTGVPAAVLSGLYAGTTGTTNKVMIHNDVETNGSDEHHRTAHARQRQQRSRHHRAEQRQHRLGATGGERGRPRYRPQHE